MTGSYHTGAVTEYGVMGTPENFGITAQLQVSIRVAAQVAAASQSISPATGKGISKAGFVSQFEFVGT
jgi:hypothetical protein